MVDFHLLKKVPLFSSLSESELAKLARLVVNRTYPKESVIFFEQDEGDSLFIMNTGKVKVAKISDEGKEIILAVLSAGDFFGDMSLLDGEPRSATVIALEDTEVYTLRRQEFLTMIRESPQTAVELLAELSHRIREANRKIGNLALLDVYGRLARMLIDFAHTEGRDIGQGRIAFRRPTHQAIANMIGTSRETVTRTLGDLHRRGYIELIGKDIVIKDNFEADFEELTA
jgi:CRP/FNR family transcriptional regulator/CRP/FNR family cyclic AMP-dependent transcriptional regulator